MSQPREWVAKCHETADWWIITQFPSGYYPRGETTRLVEKSAYDELKLAAEKIRSFDRTRGYPTGAEWMELIKELGAVLTRHLFEETR